MKTLKGKLFALLFILMSVFTLASCKDKTVTLSFVTNQEGVTLQSVTMKKGDEINLNDSKYQLTVEGYVFKGWFKDAQLSDVAKVFDVEEDMTVYAKWARINTLSFNSNGGSQVAQQKVETGSLAEKPQDPTRNGFVFVGWYKDSQFKNKFNFDTNEINADITLYAKWNEIFTVTYVVNGGSAIEPTKVEVGRTFTLPANPTKEGYSFAGWYTDQALNNAYTATGTIEANLTLYAKWDGNAFIVIYNGNGGLGNMSQQAFVYGTAKALSANQFTKVGYDFAGWALTATGEKVYDNEQSVSNLATSGSVTLYALWTNINYLVKFNVNYPEQVAEPETVANLSVKIGESVTLAQALNAISHYTFAKWTIDKDHPMNENSFAAGATLELSEDYIEFAVNNVFTFYATWTPNVYQVSFNSNEGTGTMENQSFTFGVQQALSANTFTKEGFFFVGWKDAAGNSYTDGQAITVSGNLELTAQWHDQVISVSFNANGGEGTMNAQNLAVDESTAKASGTLTSNSFTKVGHVFAGWALTATGEKVYEDHAEIETGSSVTLYALWEKATYTVKFRTSQGTGEMADLVGKFGDTANLPANSFVNTGYNFAGWGLYGSTSALFDNEQEVTLDADAIKAFDENNELTVYALWSPKRFTVTFHANGGVGENKTQEFVYGLYDNLTANSFTRTGYKFIGWSVSATDNTVAYEDKANATFADNQDLYAVWEVVVKTVELVVTDGYKVVEGVVLDSFHVQDTTNVIVDGDYAGENLNTVILAKNYERNGLTLVKITTDFDGNNAITESTTYTTEQTKINLYAYFTLTMTIDMSAIGEENVEVDVYKEKGVSESYNLFEFLPELDSISGKIVFYDKADLRNVSQSIALKVYVVDQDAQNVEEIDDLETFAITLEDNSVIYVTYLYEGTYNNTHNKVDVIFNEDTTNLFDAVTDKNAWDVKAVKSGYSIAEIEGESGAVRIFQIYTFKMTSALSATNYHVYEDLSLNSSGSRWIDQVKEAYQVGSGNIFKLRIASKDLGGNDITDLNDIDLVYFFKKGGQLGLILNQEIVYNVKVGNKTYKEAIAFSDDEHTYAYVLKTNDTDKSYVAVKFTEEANGLEFNVMVCSKKAFTTLDETCSLEFIVNGGVNVENNAELKQYYADLTVEEINIHNTIVAELNSDQYREKDGKLYPMNYEPLNQINEAQHGRPTGDVYVRAVTDATTLTHLTLNGNYFTIDGSGLPIIDDIDKNGNAFWDDEHNAVNKETSWGGTDPNTKLWVKNVQTSIFANLLAFRDPDNSHTYNYTLASDGTPLSTVDNYVRGVGAYDLVYGQSTNSVSYKNLYIIGNTITPQVNYNQTDTSKIMNDEQLAAYNSGGYNGILNRGCTANIDNVVIDYTNIGLNASCDNAVMNINDTYVFYSWANSLYGWSSCEVNLVNSEFRYSGGAAIHIDEHRNNLGSYLVKDCYDETRVFIVRFDPILTIDNKTQLINWVSGSEAWFNIYGLTMVSTLLNGVNQVVNGLTMTSNTDPTGIYSLVKSYNHLDSTDVAYTQNAEGNTTEMFNFAVLLREDGSFVDTDKNPPVNPATTGLYSAINMNVNGVNMYRQPVQVDTASYYSFATASAAGGYAKNFASQTAAYGAIVPYPVSPFSSNLDNPDDAAAAQTAALMGIHQAFDAYVAPTGATWENNSAYAMGISQNGILTRSGAATNYGYLEVNLDVTLGVGAMRCVLLTYYYAGRLIG